MTSDNVKDIGTASQYANLTTSDLFGFIGSETFTRHSIVKSVVLTEGALFLCEHGAAWLIDTIAIAQTSPSLFGEDFQSWSLLVNEDERSAVLTATDGGAAENEAGETLYKILYREEIPYTDFPLERIALYCCSNGEGINGKTILLPSEY